MWHFGSGAASVAPQKGRGFVQPHATRESAVCTGSQAGSQAAGQPASQPANEAGAHADPGAVRQATMKAALQADRQATSGSMARSPVLMQIARQPISKAATWTTKLPNSQTVKKSQASQAAKQPSDKQDE